jgi:hypothetical protein
MVSNESDRTVLRCFFCPAEAVVAPVESETVSVCGRCRRLRTFGAFVSALSDAAFQT